MDSTYKPDNIFFTSELSAIYGKAKRIAQFNNPVLIIGDPGTGKEYLANYLHEQSGIKGELITVNCASKQESLIEDFLFGHTKGGFTGAIGNKKGIFESAENGTIFFDEVGLSSNTLQMALLRVLQSGDFMSVGGERTNYIKNVRIIAATNKDIRKSDNQGFRNDLFDRLSKHIFVMPNFNDYEDTEKHQIISFMLRDVCNKHKLAEPELSEGAFIALKNNKYNGNLRELRNIIESLVLEAECNQIDELVVRHNLNLRRPVNNEYSNEVFPETLEENTRKFIYKKWLHNGKNVKRTAVSIESSENTVRKYIKNSKSAQS